MRCLFPFVAGVRHGSADTSLGLAARLWRSVCDAGGRAGGPGAMGRGQDEVWQHFKQAEGGPRGKPWQDKYEHSWHANSVADAKARPPTACGIARAC